MVLRQILLLQYLNINMHYGAMNFLTLLYVYSQSGAKTQSIQKQIFQFHQIPFPVPIIG